MKKNILSLIALLSLGIAPALSQEVAADPSFALPITGLSHDPVALSMGGAGLLSTSSTAFSAFGNSAAVPFSQLKADFAAAGDYSLSEGSLNYSAGAAFKAGRLGICVAAYLSNGESVEGADENGISTGEFQCRDMKAAAGLSYRIIENLSIGVNLRYARQDLYQGVSISAPSADAFLMGRFGGFKAAAGIENLSSGVKSESGATFPLASMAAAALGYELEAGKNLLETEVKAEYTLPSKDATDHSPLSLSAGASYTYAGIVSIRAGYHHSASQAGMPSFLSAGAGLCLRGVHIDAAYLVSETRPAAVLSLGFKF